MTDARDCVRDRADAEDALETELLVLVRQSFPRPGIERGFCHDVGGSERGTFGRTPNSSIRLVGVCPLYECDNELEVFRRDEFDAARFFRERDEICRMSGEGASSSSLHSS